MAWALSMMGRPLALGLLLLTGCGVAEAVPEQAASEVRVDHVVHAKENQIPCLYCHDHADDSIVAGVPSLERCMGCHKYVAKEKPAVQALAQMTKDETPPQWPRLYELPGYVYFSHRMHVNNDVDCAACHGAVEEMHEVQRVSSLTMGWCVDCHRDRGASLDCLTCHE